MTTTTRTPISDSYLALVSQFPLRRLRTNAEYRRALDFLTRVSLAHPKRADRGTMDYVETLAHFIDEYERRAGLKVDISGVTSADVIRRMLLNHGLTISHVAREIGITQSNLSEMLSGRREFSKAAIGGLCRRFGLSHSLFF